MIDIGIFLAFIAFVAPASVTCTVFTGSNQDTILAGRNFD